MFGAMHRAEGWIREKAGTSFDPARVETALIGLTKIWPEKAPPLRQVVESFAVGEASLIHLLAPDHSAAMAADSMLIFCSRSGHGLLIPNQST